MVIPLLANQDLTPMLLLDILLPFIESCLYLTETLLSRIFLCQLLLFLDAAQREIDVLRSEINKLKTDKMNLVRQNVVSSENISSENFHGNLLCGPLSMVSQSIIWHT